MTRYARVVALVVLVVVVIAGCGQTTERTRTAAERGEALATTTSISPSRFNAYACTTCHAVTSAADRVLPAAPLGGAARRPNFWGGRLLTLQEAVDECARRFMRMTALDPGAREAIDLYAYLESIAEKGPSSAQPFDVAIATADLPAGDAARGARTWERACRQCHGEIKTGAGRITSAAGTTPASLVPNDTLDLHGKDGIPVARQVIIEKIRHGAFLGFPGIMPPFSRNVLSDADVSDLAAYLGLYP